MNDIKISVIMLILNTENLNNALESLLMQSSNTWEVFFLVNENIKDMLPVNIDNRVKVMEVKSNTSIFNSIKDIIEALTGDYICILNSEDINHDERFLKQSSFLETNRDVSIVSCLHMPIYKEEAYLKNAIMSNRFTSSDTVDDTILGGFLSLDLYTFMIRASLLKKLSKFMYLYNFESEIDLVLYLLRYSKISKLPEVLYYTRKQRIPYKESLYYDDNIQSKNKLVQFNTNNSLTLREYFSAILNNKYSIYNAPYKHSNLVILDTVKIGGTETHVLSMAKHLLQKGIKTVILTKECLAVEEYILNGIEIITLDLYNEKMLEATTIKLLKVHDFKEINLHMVSDISLCPILKKLTNLDITLTIHGSYYPEDILHDYSKYFSKITFVSETTKDIYIDSIDNKDKIEISVKPNLINKISIKPHKNYIHKLLNLPLTSKVILYCSRLSYSKAYGAVQFLESFEVLAKDNDNIYAVIVGDGDSKILVDTKIDKINTTLNKTRAFALGGKYNLYDFYFDSSIVIGTGRVALEAINCGRPVIALGLKGYNSIVAKDNIKSLVANNFGDHTGGKHLTQSTIYSKELTESLNYLLTNPKEARLLSKWSRAYCHKFLCFKDD